MTPRVKKYAFSGENLYPDFGWMNEPANWRIANQTLLIQPAANTDFWQRTHYGFRADNGHFLYAPVSTAATVSTVIHSRPVHQYDQAGLMVRFGEEDWLKTSIEYEEDAPAKLGAVVTRNGYSDWSIEDIPARKHLCYSLRIQRQGADFIVEYRSAEESEWRMLRMAHLSGSGPALAGLYACSPKGSGYYVEVQSLTIEE